MANYNVLNNDLQLMERCGKAPDKKAYSDLSYVGHKTIHIDLPFSRSRESKHVSRTLTEGVKNASTAIYENVKALA